MLPVPLRFLVQPNKLVTLCELLLSTLGRPDMPVKAMLASVNHPAVVEKTVEVAMTPEGVKDREFLHKHVGFIPVGSGQPQQPLSVTVNANSSAVAEAKVANVLAPTPETTVRRLTDRLNAARGIAAVREAPALPAASAEPLPMELLANRGVPATLISSVSRQAEADLEDYERQNEPETD